MRAIAAAEPLNVFDRKDRLLRLGQQLLNDQGVVRTVFDQQNMN